MAREDYGTNLSSARNQLWRTQLDGRLLLSKDATFIANCAKKTTLGFVVVGALSLGTCSRRVPATVLPTTVIEQS